MKLGKLLSSVGLLFLLVFTGCSLVPDTGKTAGSRAIDTTGYNLVWSDEFDGSSVDTSKWAFDIGGGGWGNNEWEYYRAENATVSGGYLTITAKQESYGGYNYTSSRMKTKGKYEFTYGKVVARLKMSGGNRTGIWPAFWMLGANIDSVSWPACGEIDVFENIGDNNVYSTCHWLDDASGGHASYGLSTSTSVTDFHDYEIEWDSQFIRARVDNGEYFVIDITPGGLSEFRAPFFLLLNVAVGGNWPGYPNASTTFPAAMTVDYVRVYQKSDGTDGGGETTIPATIQAEDYSLMSGVQTESCADAGGTLNVGWIDAGDWMVYPIKVPSTGAYTVSYRVASPSGGTLSSDLNGGSTQLGSVGIPATGGWQNWTTVTQNVTLNAGSYNFGIYAQTGGWNINWFSIQGADGGSSGLPFISGFEPGETQPTWSDSIDWSSNVSGYFSYIAPECSIRQERAQAGVKALMYSGTANGGSSTFVYYKVFQTNFKISSTTQLAYWIFPQSDNGRYVAVDFHCTDGTTLRDSGAVDQFGRSMHPNGGHGGSIPLNAWSVIICNVGQYLNGKTVDRIWVAYDRPGSTGQFRGYIDDIGIR